MLILNIPLSKQKTKKTKTKHKNTKSLSATRFTPPPPIPPKPAGETVLIFTLPSRARMKTTAPDNQQDAAPEYQRQHDPDRPQRQDAQDFNNNDPMRKS